MLRYFMASVIFFGGTAPVLIACATRPFRPATGLWWARTIPRMVLRAMGLKMEIRHHERMRDNHPCVYITNHQAALDLFVHAHTLIVPTVGIGKKEIKWVPFFGWLFWLTGQIMIDRKHHRNAMDAMAVAAKHAKKNNLSVYMFPEGTRSHGKPLQPFKKGAFHLAISAQIPLLPIVACSYHKNLDLNQWNPGRVIVDVLEPIPTQGKTEADVSSLIELAHSRMRNRIDELDAELAAERKQS